MVNKDRFLQLIDEKRFTDVDVKVVHLVERAREDIASLSNEDSVMAIERLLPWQHE